MSNFECQKTKRKKIEFNTKKTILTMFSSNIKSRPQFRGQIKLLDPVLIEFFVALFHWYNNDITPPGYRKYNFGADFSQKWQIPVLFYCLKVITLFWHFCNFCEKGVSLNLTYTIFIDAWIFKSDFFCYTHKNPWILSV